MAGVPSFRFRDITQCCGVALAVVAALASGGCDALGGREHAARARAQRAVLADYGLKAARFGPASPGRPENVICGVVTGQDSEGLVAERPYVANGALGVALIPNLTRIAGPPALASPLAEELTGACEFIGLWRDTCATPPPDALARAAATCGGLR